jgi:NADPH2:quinone reductase
MVQAVRFHETGGPEVLHWQTVDVGAPAPGQARVRHHAVGLNFIDTYHRTGLYPLPLPSGIGLEGAGRGRGRGRGRQRMSRCRVTAWRMPAARSAPMPKFA